MDPNQRIDLSKLIKEYNSEDTTDQIRQLKHSSNIKQDVAYLENLKMKYSRLRHTNKEQFKNICQKQCSFLYNNYTNIFNRLVNDELDLTILSISSSHFYPHLTVVNINVLKAIKPFLQRKHQTTTFKTER